MSLLLENGAEVEMKEVGNRTPLVQAINNGSIAVIKLLLNNGAKVDCWCRLNQSWRGGWSGNSSEGDPWFFGKGYDNKGNRVYDAKLRDEMAETLHDLEDVVEEEFGEEEYPFPYDIRLEYVEWHLDMSFVWVNVRTPLLQAMEKRNDAAVTLLLEKLLQNSVKPSPKKRRVLLWWAKNRGNEAILKLVEQYVQSQ